MDLDLVNSVIGLQQAKTMSSVQIAVAKKIMDADKSEGEAMVKLIQAASGGAAQAGDKLVAAATGLGGSLDTYA